MNPVPARRPRVPQPTYRTRAGFKQANLPVLPEQVVNNNLDWLPPPVYTTDMWAANQIWPL